MGVMSKDADGDGGCCNSVNSVNVNYSSSNKPSWLQGTLAGVSTDILLDRIS